MGSKSFVELFVVKVLHEDFGMIFNFTMFVDPLETFAMFYCVMPNALATCFV
jgi:hypothetical protein